MRPSLHTLRISTLATSTLALTIGCSKVTTSASGDEGGSTAAPGASPPSGAAPAMGAGTPSLAFLEGFEGEIDATVTKGTPPAAPMPVAALIKSGKFRFDIPEKLTEGGAGRMLGPKAYAIFDSQGKKLTAVSDARKQAIVIDLNRGADQFKSFGHTSETGGGGAPQGPTTKVTKTGKFDTVAGYKCENWDIASDHHEGTVCVAHEGISWFSVPAAVIPSERAWMLELMDGKHFPLRFIGYGKDGTTEETRLEITKIDKRTLPDSSFEYPADYRVTDLEQMFRGLGGMAGGMAGMPPGAMPPGMPSGFTMPQLPPGFTMPTRKAH
jgi:hypothetical protein